MYAAILLCSAILSADTDVITIRMVNTLEEPVQVRFRIVGKEDWVKPDLALDSAQTKNVTLPKGKKFEVEVRDKNEKFFRLGVWDLVKVLEKDAKAEIHVAEIKKSLGRDAPKPGAVRRFVTICSTLISDDGKRREQTRFIELEEVPNSASILAGETASSHLELIVFSAKRYFPIEEFISGKPVDHSDAAFMREPEIP